MYIYIIYIHIRITELLQTNIFGNNVSGRQWWCFGGPERWQLHADRSSKFCVECRMCQWLPIRLYPCHIFPGLDTVKHRMLECPISWCFCLDASAHQCSVSRTGKEVSLSLTCFTTWHTKVQVVLFCVKMLIKTTIKTDCIRNRINMIMTHVFNKLLTP